MFILRQQQSVIFGVAPDPMQSENRATFGIEEDLGPHVQAVAEVKLFKMETWT